MYHWVVHRSDTGHVSLIDNWPLQGAQHVGGAEDEREGDEVAHHDAGEQHERQLAPARAHHRRVAARRPHAAHQTVQLYHIFEKQC